MKRYYLAKVVGSTLLLMVVGVAAIAEERVARLAMVLTLEPGLQVRGYSGFWERLSELGWTKGKNLLVYEVSAEGQANRFGTLMNDVLSKHVDVIVTGSTPGALAARKATSTVPIVSNVHG